MESYHGTSTSEASNIASGNVNVTLGGGELGRGFYTAEYIYDAKAWAFHKTGNKQNNVVKFDHNDDDIEDFNYTILSRNAVGQKRRQIRNNRETRTYLFGYDMIWAPIVGSNRAHGNQFKWETESTQFYLNSNFVTRTVM